MVDVVVTTAGGVEEDFIKCLRPTFMGDFHLGGKDLRARGLWGETAPEAAFSLGFRPLPSRISILSPQGAVQPHWAFGHLLL